VTELAFVRIVPQLPGLGASVEQAKELLRRLKRQRRVRVRILADAVGADHLPAWVKTVRRTTDGHLLELAKRHSTALATLDDKIPGAFLVPDRLQRTGMTGYTHAVKTAISLPDELSAAIDACARDLKMTRSGLLAQAAREFVARRRRGPDPTEAWNRVIENAGQPGDDPAARAFRRRTKAVVRASGRSRR